jgi:hypothetical protein
MMSNGNFSPPNVRVTPAGGTGITEVGMFNISVTPANPTDQILALQFIASIQDQPQGDFSAFVLIGDLPQGAGLPSAIFYASCNAVTANQSGQALTVQIAGGINSAVNAFDIPIGFTGNLWPGATCSMG